MLQYLSPRLHHYRQNYGILRVRLDLRGLQDLGGLNLSPRLHHYRQNYGILRAELNFWRGSSVDEVD